MLERATAMRTGEGMATIPGKSMAKRAADRLRALGRYLLAGWPREIH
jgi:hypothetical protein